MPERTISWSAIASLPAPPAPPPRAPLPTIPEGHTVDGYDIGERNFYLFFFGLVLMVLLLGRFDKPHPSPVPETELSVL